MEALRRKVTDDALERLRGEILRGEHQAGQDLPGERELALRLGVSRLTLRAGLARLESEGLVRPVHGSGTRVLDWRQTGGIELLGHLVTLGAEGTPGILASILELRRYLAVEAFGMVAERASAAELGALRAQVRRLAEAADKGQEYVREDLFLARMVARSTHNVAVSLVANTIVRMLEREPALAAVYVLDPKVTVAFYGRVLDLAEARRPERVRAFARRLLGRLDRVTLEALGVTEETLAPREAGL
ncbi:MAG: FadR family transcriptional regulator [Deltaproteobacteria bacterium]|nr:FadR family transcriptional regulator [Deltaproteobacteria bacterium]